MVIITLASNYIVRLYIFTPLLKGAFTKMLTGQLHNVPPLSGIAEYALGIECMEEFLKSEVEKVANNPFIPYVSCCNRKALYTTLRFTAGL